MEKKSATVQTVRKKKDHGADKGSFLGSKLKDGDRVVMIEDVTTSGKIHGRDSTEGKRCG